MQVMLVNNAEEFLSRARPYLEKDKVTHSFILSLAEKYVMSGKPVHRAILAVDGDVQLAAMQTEADRALIVSDGNPRAVSALVQYLKQHKIALPGIYGLALVVEQFSSEMEAKVKTKTGLRLFQLRRVIPPKPPEGSARFANPMDLDTIMQWQKEFYVEAVPHDPVMSDENLRKYLADSINQKQWFIWEVHGKPVCMVGSMRETEIDRWIAPVYTPLHLRGKGYGSALTAYVSQFILDSGKTAMLNTDLANPTSNSIYQKIGYEPVADFAHDIYSNGKNG